MFNLLLVNKAVINTEEVLSSAKIFRYNLFIIFCENHQREVTLVDVEEEYNLLNHFVDSYACISFIFSFTTNSHHAQNLSIIQKKKSIGDKALGAHYQMIG